MKRDEIGNFTAIMFTPLPTCLTLNDCHSCQSSDIGFDCIWCDEVKRCSDGLDRYRQEWLAQNCSQKKEKIKCGSNSSEALPSVEPTNVINHTTEKYIEYTLNPIKSNITTLPNAESTPETKYKIISTDDQTGSSSARVGEKEEDMSVSVGGVIGIIVTIGIIIGMGLWILYAYRYPQTPSGQFLIRYRPSRWRFRHGEAHYTAASIHM